MTKLRIIIKYEYIVEQTDAINTLISRCLKDQIPNTIFQSELETLSGQRPGEGVTVSLANELNDDKLITIAQEWLGNETKRRIKI